MDYLTVRIELHGAHEGHYELLHASMAARGFYRFISGTTVNGTPGKWKLPTAEYDHASDLTAAEIRDSVKLLADSIKPGAWVLVTKVAERAWTTAMLPN